MLVIPVHNSAATLPELIAQLRQVLPTVAERYEVILVNDGIHDRSWEVIARLADEHAWVRGIDLMRNYGQHNALLAGIRAARYDVTVTMDDDLESLCVHRRPADVGHDALRCGSGAAQSIC